LPERYSDIRNNEMMDIVACFIRHMRKVRVISKTVIIVHLLISPLGFIDAGEFIGSSESFVIAPRYSAVELVLLQILSRAGGLPRHWRNERSFLI